MSKKKLDIWIVSKEENNSNFEEKKLNKVGQISFAEIKFDIHFEASIWIWDNILHYISIWTPADSHVCQKSQNQSTQKYCIIDL